MFESDVGNVLFDENILIFYADPSISIFLQLLAGGVEEE